ncbi:hypothetical protein G5714_016575 [Onychostoma macrolepis]|uniref:Uncharacterized protein n=1 Tax=Onychostoma macrolepis TaxID=369639 RepID=A0A7J6CD01_9TELE|nr:hypothetical protein G5714_016575 [Onychostoma macrolepis]
MNLTSSLFPSLEPFKRSTRPEINPQPETPESGLSTYSCHFQVEVSDCQKIEAEQWHSPSISDSSFKPPHGSLQSTAFGQQCQKGQRGPGTGEHGENEKQPCAPSECSIHRSRQTGTAARWDGQRTKGVLLLIDCKISRASQWDQRKTAADGAGPDTLVERALPTC